MPVYESVYEILKPTTILNSHGEKCFYLFFDIRNIQLKPRLVYPTSPITAMFRIPAIFADISYLVYWTDISAGIWGLLVTVSSMYTSRNHGLVREQNREQGLG